jgi:hypothetical protein
MLPVFRFIWQLATDAGLQVEMNRFKFCSDVNRHYHTDDCTVYSIIVRF